MSFWIGGGLCPSLELPQVTGTKWVWGHNPTNLSTSVLMCLYETLDWQLEDSVGWCCICYKQQCRYLSLNGRNNLSDLSPSDALLLETVFTMDWPPQTLCSKMRWLVCVLITRPPHVKGHGRWLVDDRWLCCCIVGSEGVCFWHSKSRAINWLKQTGIMIIVLP